MRPRRSSSLGNRAARAAASALTGVVLVGGLVGCATGAPKDSPQQGVDRLQIPTPDPDPEEFSAEVDNAYLPLSPGARWRYRLTEARGTAVVTVSASTREIDGVQTRAQAWVIRNRRGEVVERRTAWFAQDNDGNVWCFGSAVTRLRNGTTTAERAWEAGVDGAQASMAMLERPRQGDGYVREDGPGEARVSARIVDLERTVETGAVERKALVTQDLDERLPGVVESRSYTRGIGLVRVDIETDLSGSPDFSGSTDFSGSPAAADRPAGLILVRFTPAP